jgi:hypothetical protein
MKKFVKGWKILFSDNLLIQSQPCQNYDQLIYNMEMKR